MRNLVIANGSVIFSSTQKKLDRIGIIDLKTGNCRFTDIHFPKVKDKNIFVLENTVIDNTIYALVGVETDVYLLRLDMQGNQLGANNLTADIAERIISHQSQRQEISSLLQELTLSRRKVGRKVFSSQS